MTRDRERQEAIRHLSYALVEIWCGPDPSSEKNKARRQAILGKLRKWRKGK